MPGAFAAQLLGASGQQLPGVRGATKWIGDRDTVAQRQRRPDLAVRFGDQHRLGRNSGAVQVCEAGEPAGILGPGGPDGDCDLRGANRRRVVATRLPPPSGAIGVAAQILDSSFSEQLH